jgi:alkanesulfonate monooxygenase SsuD/methylene tetrahydromethanopterin reductase-like flavin-dependent oxidoreductase (luciferase family)
MEFGFNFFPCLRPSEKSAAQYFDECLALTALADRLGYHHVRQVEHYFEAYGGYSPNPLIFLAAAAKVSARLRLVTGAVLPAFNNPLKLAGEIAMLDGISGGRLDVGFARAFLPHEFERFGIPIDESRARFDEGVAQIRLLLTGENVSHRGRFHAFANVTSLPRCTQVPHPPLWIAAIGTPESFEAAGRAGLGIMVIPIEAGKMAELLGRYREAWRAAGHPGNGAVMNSFLACVAETRDAAIADFRAPVNGHLAGLVEGAAGWLTGASTKDYPGYDKMIAQLKTETFDAQLAKGLVWCGSPADVTDMMIDYHRRVGGFEIASLHASPATTPFAVARRTMELFAHSVMPRAYMEFGRGAA